MGEHYMTRKRKNKEQETAETKSEELDLAKKYRPKTLDEFKGNAPLKKTLKSVIENNKIPQCVLFHGDFGSGKTTLARIFAEHLNCSEFDLKEIDIADFSGVDTIREIRKKMATAPMKGDVKVWVMDEVHKLSQAGQNALLKALEEPPKHCYFFLCTTDPQNLINTVKSRCVQYQVSALPQKQLHDLLNSVAEKENVTLPKKVGLQICKDSLGHPRDALKILQKIIHLDEDDMLEAAKQEAEKQEQAITLCRELINGSSWKKIAEILKSLDQDPEEVRRTVRGYFTSVLLNGNTIAYFVLDALKQPLYSTDAKNELVRSIFEAHSDLND